MPQAAALIETDSFIPHLLVAVESPHNLHAGVCHGSQAASIKPLFVSHQCVRIESGSSHYSLHKEEFTLKVSDCFLATFYSLNPCTSSKLPNMQEYIVSRDSPALRKWADQSRGSKVSRPVAQRAGKPMEWCHRLSSSVSKPCIDQLGSRINPGISVSWSHLAFQPSPLLAKEFLTDGHQVSAHLP